MPVAKQLTTLLTDGPKVSMSTIEQYHPVYWYEPILESSKFFIRTQICTVRNIQCLTLAAPPILSWESGGKSVDIFLVFMVFLQTIPLSPADLSRSSGFCVISV